MTINFGITVIAWITVCHVEASSVHGANLGAKGLFQTHTAIQYIGSNNTMKFQIAQAQVKTMERTSIIYESPKKINARSESILLLLFESHCETQRMLGIYPSDNRLSTIQHRDGDTRHQNIRDMREYVIMAMLSAATELKLRIIRVHV